MRHLLALIDRSSRTAETLAVVLVYGYCALMLAEVFARGFLGTSLPYSWEYGTYAMAGAFFLAAGPAIRTAVHVRITLLSDALPARAARQVDLAANLVALAIVAIVIEAVWTTVSTSFARGLTSPTVVRTPLAIPQAAILIGCAQLFLDLLARLLRRATGQDYEWRDADAPPDDARTDERRA